MDSHFNHKGFSLLPSFRSCRCVSDVLERSILVTGNPLYASPHDPLSSTTRPRSSATSTPKNGETEAMNPDSKISSDMDGSRYPPATALLPLGSCIKGRAKIDQPARTKSSLSSNGGWFISEEDEEKEEAEVRIKSDSFSVFPSDSSDSSFLKLSESQQSKKGTRSLEKSPRSFDGIKDGETESTQVLTDRKSSDVVEGRRCSPETSLMPLGWYINGGANNITPSKITKSSTSSSNDGWFSSEEEEKEEGEISVKSDSFSSLSMDSSDSSLQKISESLIIPLPSRNHQVQSKESINLTGKSPELSRKRENLKSKSRPNRETGKPRRRRENDSTSAGRKTGEDDRRYETQRFAVPVGGGKVEDIYAVVQTSSDPYKDFRESMVEMIVEKELHGAEELENLLQCFLSLNSPHHHRVILQVFIEICEALLNHS
ncbi:hypothetical protein NMG60_11000853 [Bertholletia excelsa]